MKKAIHLWFQHPGFSGKFPKAFIAACLMAALFLTAESPLRACGGTPVPPCAGKAVFLAKFAPGVVVFPAAGPIFVPIGVLPFAFWDTRPQCPLPVSATLSLTLTCFPSGTVIGPLFFAVPVPTLPGAQPLGGPVIFVIPAGTFPPGTPPQACLVTGTYTVGFSDGVTLAGIGDTEVCLVPPSPLDAGKPRLGMNYISEDGALYRTCRRGDQGIFYFLIANNDPVHAVTLTLTSMGRQVAHLPNGFTPANAYANNVYSISYPEAGTDTYPAAFADTLPPGELLPEPNPFAVNPQSLTRSLTLLPGEAIIIAIAMRSFGMCANGSCNERLVKVEGSFANGDPALACASTLHVVGDPAPKTVLCEYSDAVKVLPGSLASATWSTAQFFNGQNAIPHASTFYAGNIPPAQGQGFRTTDPSNPFPSSGTDYLRMTVAPTAVFYMVNFNDPPSGSCNPPSNAGSNMVWISGLNNTTSNIVFPAISHIQPGILNVDYNLSTGMLGISLNSNLIFQGPAGSFFSQPPEGFCIHFDVCRTFSKTAGLADKAIYVVPPALARLFGVPIPIPPPCDTLEVFNEGGMPENWNGTLSGSGLSLPAASGFHKVPVCYANLASLPIVPNTTVSFVNIACPGALNNPVSIPIAIRVMGCAPNLAVTGNPLAAGTYRSVGNLTASNATVASGSQVVLTSDTGILLNPNFTVVLGAVLDAIIGACPTINFNGPGQAEEKN